ncbi:MAG: phosphatidylglycerophosphatase A [Gammaproteobacteria bacterium]|nr:phosphatidylglycerophosphatase A [Gammaproteobacteria bacterium]NNC97711.1 phosphatidylglycerophosphatase A [Gammaproteobacteria bacterium]NNM14047.1 phosphatidylglycerophosphatase A [Gammaproteobacteria bacterium]
MSKKSSIPPAELRQQFIKHPVHWLALGFGTGLVPKAPGTAGTLAALPFILLTASQSLSIKLLILAIISLLGIWICGKSADLLGVHDHGSIVWDEIAGFYLVMLFAAVSIPALLIGFALFRFFDIIKPWPIKQLDAHVHGGLGIMLDDLIAGLFAGAGLYLCDFLLSNYTGFTI